MNFTKNETILITGGTGTFGHAVVERFLYKTKIGKIRIFSRDEKKQHDMRNEFNDKRLEFQIGDVRDRSSVKKAMNRVTHVFHASALKQVPSCEFHPIEAIKTNVLGAENVIQEAIDQKVHNVIVLSTDKAVYPINVMGMTKALMEKIMLANFRNHSNFTKLSGTRYGNVMGSRGSVIEKFIDQAKKNQNITITDPNMTRFMMTIDEAVDLVLYAFTEQFPGSIFVKKSPACTIEVLAKAIIKIFESKSKVIILGTRHGEKMHESLLSCEEMSNVIDCGEFYRIPPDTRDLNYDLYFNEGKSTAIEESYNSSNTKRLNVDEMCELLYHVKIIQDEINEI